MSKVSNASDLEGRPGLHAAKRVLQGIFAQTSPVHAVLLFGEEGSGKSAVAQALAAYWLCKSPSENGPCAECQPCRTLAKGSAGDLLMVQPLGASSIIRLPAVHRVEQTPTEYENIVPIQDFLRTMPIVARNKVIWVERADRMNSDAAKAFLKTLEEPPAYGKFILATTELSRIETTIRSRCMAIPCELPQLEAWALAAPDAEPWEAALADRSVGRLTRIREHREVFKGIFQLGREMATMSPGGALAAAERFRKLIEQLQKEDEGTARAAGADALRALGTVLMKLGFSPVSTQRVAQAHRRIVGNVAAGYELDALFTAILMENGRMPAGYGGQKVPV